MVRVSRGQLVFNVLLMLVAVAGYQILVDPDIHGAWHVAAEWMVGSPLGWCLMSFIFMIADYRKY